MSRDFTDIPVVPLFFHRPAYVRIPKADEVCPVSGLTRNRIREIVIPCEANGHKPPVKSLVKRGPDGRVTLRLVHVKSLLAWTEENSEGG